MNFVQSFWSCNHSHPLSFKAGWYAPEYNWMGLALSCLQLKKYHAKVTLYTDTTGADWIVDTLQLPYDEVHCELDNLNRFHPKLWALPKIYTYSKQSTPFLHVDNDVFIWKAFDHALLDSPLIAQNKEAASSYYETIMKTLEEHLTYFPEAILEDRASGNPILAYNAGIFGGRDVDFFHEYTQIALKFIQKNEYNLSKINPADFNVFFEQYLFYCLTVKHEKKVAVLLPEVIGDNEYLGFGDFLEVPHQKSFLHLIGTYKRNREVCELLADRLRLENPEYYYRIISLYNRGHITLHKDYYIYSGIEEEQVLCENSQKLMDNYTRGQLSPIGENPVNPNEAAREFKAILSDKFAKIDLDYLYARELIHTTYFERIFGTFTAPYKISLMVDPFVELVETDHFVALVPECYKPGYSLVDLDELDWGLLSIAKSPTSIDDILKQIGLCFDQEDLRENYKEFETLIFGRIKQFLHHKMIKPVSHAVQTL